MNPSQLKTCKPSFLLRSLSLLAVVTALCSSQARAQEPLEHRWTASGAVGFLSGFRGVGRRGRRVLAELLEVACAGDEVAAKGRLGDHVPITLGAGDRRLSTSELVRLLAGGRASKILAAGNTVAARVDLDGRPRVVIAEMTNQRRRDAG